MTGLPTQPYGMPGDRYTRGNPYFRLTNLLQQGNVNNGTNAGGLAHVGNQLVRALLMKEGLDQEKARDAAAVLRREQFGEGMASVIQGAQAKPWVNPDTGSATIPDYQPPGAMGPPKMVPTATAGGVDGMLSAIRQSGNPDLGPLASQLLSRVNKPETFHAPVGAIGPDGKPTYIMPGSGGTIRPITGYSPVPRNLLSGSQDANNFETRYARQRILALADKRRPGESIRDVIKRTTLRQSDTGRENPMYDQFIANDFRSASNRMVGQDDDFEKFMQSLDDKAPVPERRQQPAAKESGGTMDGALKWLGGLLNLREDKPEGAPPAAAATGSAGTPPAAYPDARRAADGNWYVEKNGQFFRVVQ